MTSGGIDFVRLAIDIQGACLQFNLISFRFQMTADPAIPAIHLPEAVMRVENGLHVFFKER